MRKLYLDDLRIPKTDGWSIVRSYDEFVSWVTSNGAPDVVSFDHDLGEDVMTGYDCVKWLVEYCIENNVTFPQWNVHSANPVGKENIERYIVNFLKHK